MRKLMIRPHCAFQDGPPSPLIRSIHLIFGVNLTSDSIDPDTVADCIDTYPQSFLPHVITPRAPSPCDLILLIHKLVSDDHADIEGHNDEDNGDDVHNGGGDDNHWWEVLPPAADRWQFSQNGCDQRWFPPQCVTTSRSLIQLIIAHINQQPGFLLVLKLKNNQLWKIIPYI